MTPVPDIIASMARKHQTLIDGIRQAVRDCGMTQYRIAKLTGIDESAVSKFVRGKGGLGIDGLNALAELLNLRIVAGEPKAISSREPRQKGK